MEGGLFAVLGGAGDFGHRLLGARSGDEQADGCERAARHELTARGFTSRYLRCGAAHQSLHVRSSVWLPDSQSKHVEKICSTSYFLRGMICSYTRRWPIPYPRNHRRAVKKKIVNSARKLFNRRGFDNVSLGEIMAGAGLTHGGFY